MGATASCDCGGEARKQQNQTDPLLAPEPQPRDGSKLIEAVRSGETDAVKAALAETPVALEAVDKHGDTALLVAAANGYTEIAEMLLQAGANANAVGEDGQSALDLTMSLGDDETVALLRKYSRHK